jgi:hypothetical protein
VTGSDDPSQHLFWLASRATGIEAMVLVSLSVGLGLSLSGGSFRRPGVPAKLKVLHEALSISGLVAAVIVASFYVRGLIGTAAWRRLHRWTFAVWALGLVHTLGAGSDARSAWLLLVLGLTALPAGALLPLRSRRAGPSRRAAGPRIGLPRSSKSG